MSLPTLGADTQLFFSTWLKTADRRAEAASADCTKSKPPPVQESEAERLCRPPAGHQTYITLAAGSLLSDPRPLAVLTPPEPLSPSESPV